MNRKEKSVQDETGVLQPLEVVWRGGAGRDGGESRQMNGKWRGRLGHGRQEGSVPFQKKRRSRVCVSEPSPKRRAGARQETPAPEEELGAWPGTAGAWPGPGPPTSSCR